MIDTIYDEIVLLCKKMTYRDKLRLAQLLIQLARKEEETANCESRLVESNENQSQSVKVPNNLSNKADRIKYIMERLKKSTPKNRKSLSNFIESMFQFRGAISDVEVEEIISELQKNTHIKIDSNNKVTYNI